MAEHKSHHKSCLKKKLKCLKWITACQEPKHFEHIAKRDVSRDLQFAIQDKSSTYPTPSLKPEVHAVTLTITGSAALGLLLGMATMYLILWQCKRRRWNALDSVIRAQDNPLYDENAEHIHNEPGRYAPRHHENFSTLDKQVSRDTSNENRAHGKGYSDPLGEGNAYDAFG